MDLDVFVYAINGLIAHHSGTRKNAKNTVQGDKSQGGKGKYKSKKATVRTLPQSGFHKGSACRPDVQQISMATLPPRAMVGHLFRVAWELHPSGLGLGLQFPSFSRNVSVAPRDLHRTSRTHLNSLQLQRGPWIPEKVRFAPCATMPILPRGTPCKIPIVIPTQGQVRFGQQPR